jgi:hypothetical protein
MSLRRASKIPLRYFHHEERPTGNTQSGIPACDAESYYKKSLLGTGCPALTAYFFGTSYCRVKQNVPLARNISASYRCHTQSHANHSLVVGFEVFTAVVIKSIIFWDVTPCSLAEKIFLPRRWRRYVPPKRRLHLNRLHGVTSQKMTLFIL